MPYQQLIALLPCHSLDDFPFHLEGAAADEILAAYTVLWHPSLIAEARAVPTWRRNDSDGEISWDEALVALPQVCRDDMPGYWLEELRATGVCVLDCGDWETAKRCWPMLLSMRQRVVQTLTPSWSAIFLPLVFVIY